jgi:hypothetical protein
MMSNYTYFDSHELTWQTPPPRFDVKMRSHHAQERWTRVAEALKDNPGEWAVVAQSIENKTLTPSQIRKALGYNFEVVTRRSDGVVRAYARWVPEE